MAKASTKGQKIGVLIFYIVLILGLLAGFLIPMDFEAEDLTSTMLIMQVPDALAKFLSSFGITIEGLSAAVVTGGGTLPELAISAPMSFMSGTLAIVVDMNAWLTVFYALITVIAVICLIPAIVGCVTKKDKETKLIAKVIKKARKEAKKNGDDPDEVEAALLADIEAQKEAKDPFADDPAEAKSKKKKPKETTLRTASGVGALAAMFLFLINLFIIINMQYSGTSYCLPVATAFAVVLAAGFIGRVIANGGSGVVKLILFILSLAALLFTFFNICAIIPSLSEYISSILPEDASIAAGFYGGEGALDLEYLCNFVFLTEGSLGDLLVGVNASGIIWIVFSFILGVMVLVNCFFDLLGIYKKTTSGMLVMNQVRYFIEIIALIFCVIMVLLLTDVDFGMLLIGCAILVLVGWIINIARLSSFRNKERQEAKTPDEVEQMLYFAPAKKETPQVVHVSSFTEPAYTAYYHGTAYISSPYSGSAYHAPAHVRNKNFYPSLEDTLKPIDAPMDIGANAPCPPAPGSSGPIPYGAPAPAPAPAPRVAQAQAYAEHSPYAGAVYSGPVDKFMARLSNEEKIEFARVFLERAEGALSSIPEYRVGAADNSAFFSGVMIHYAAVRRLVSSGLMEKLFDAASPRD